MDTIEKRIIELIDANAEKIMAFGDDIWHHAELGFMEHRTSAKFCEELRSLGLEVQEHIAVTGAKAYLKEKQEGELRLALMGEMDALPFGDHCDANPETHAAHCCGHDAQITGVLGAAYALTDPQVREALGGNVVFMAAPCEEGATEPETKKRLMNDGLIRYNGGKCELIRVGAMDDIAATIGHHVKANSDQDDAYMIVNRPSMGFVEKYITFEGIKQHPANCWKAVDALTAARLAMNNVDAQREGFQNRFKNLHHIVHGYIKNGGEASNIVSNHVEMDYNIRGTSIAAMQDMGYRVDRSLKGAAVATGAGLEIRTEPGYLPVIPVREEDTRVVEEVYELVAPGHPVHSLPLDAISGTTDFGDLSNLMPVIQFYTCGQAGQGHTIQYRRTDLYEYYVVPAKCFALLAYRLLRDNAALLKELVKENPREMTRETYVELMESMRRTEVMEMKPVPQSF